MLEFITNILVGIRQWVNGKIADVNTAIESKQNSSDNSLNTNTKTIIGAINELLTRIEALEARNNAFNSSFNESFE